MNLMEARRDGRPQRVAGTAARARLLGAVRVDAAGESVSLGGVTSRLVFAMLLLAHGQPVSRSRLVEAIWGEAASGSDSALRVAITRLRKAIGPTQWVVESAHGGYQLLGVEHSDVFDLDRLEAAVRTSASDDERFRALVEALALWDGQSLLDLRSVGAGWHLATRLDARRSALRDRLYEVAGSLGRLQHCLHEFADWVGDDQFDEVAACALSAALAASGRSTAALRQLNNTRLRLAEAGMVPTSTLLHLESRLLASDNAGPGPPPTMSLDRFLPPAIASFRGRAFVGRLADIERLHSDWRLAELGGSVVVRVCGAAGVGKSALLARFAGDLDDDGVVVAYGSCGGSATTPFDPWLTVLSQLGAGVPPEPPHGVDGQDDSAARLTMVELGVGALGDAVDARRVMVIIDDLQWADELTIAGLHRLLVQPIAEALLVVVVERDLALSRLAHRRLVSHQLHPLTAAEIEPLLVNDRRWTASDLHALTGGLPLLVEEALRQGNDSDLAPIGSALFYEQASGLESAVLDTVTVAALLGAQFSFGDLVAVVGLDELLVLEHLDAAIHRGFVDDSISDRLRFTHELYRRAAIARWSRLRTTRAHVEILDRLDLESTDPIRALQHASECGEFIEPARLVRCSVAAAQRQLE